MNEYDEITFGAVQQVIKLLNTSHKEGPITESSFTK